MADSVTQDEGLSLDALRKMFRAWHDNKQAELIEQRLSKKYYHGKQWDSKEQEELKRRKQPIVTSNRIKRKVDFLVGMEQRQRRDPKAYPRTPKHKEHAELATDSIRFVCDNNSWPELASMAAHDGLVPGIGAVKIGVRKTRKQTEIEIRHVLSDAFFYDPRSTRPDFDDARYMGEHKWLDVADAESMLDIKIDREALEALAYSDEDYVSSRDEDKDPLWWDMERRRVRLIEMYYKHKGEWRLCQFAGAQKFRDIASPFHDDDGEPGCPYEAWSPYVDEEGVHYGVVRDMKSPQDEVNHRRSKLLHMLNVRQTAGETGAVKDVPKMKRQAATADGHIEYAPGKKFEFIDQSQQMAGQAELLQEAKGEIENLGPNPGLVGRGVEKQSGRAILAQQNSGMTELSPVFERLRMWKLRVYRAVWARIRQYWDTPRWIRITDVDGEVEFVAINQLIQTQQIDPATGMETIGVQVQNPVAEIDADIILDEGPDTLTIQEEEFEMIADMVAKGLQIPPHLVLELSNLRNKDKIIEELRGNPEQQQANAEREQMIQNEAMRLEFADKQADLDLKQAKVAGEVADVEKTQADTAKTMLETVAMGASPGF